MTYGCYRDCSILENLRTSDLKQLERAARKVGAKITGTPKG